MQVFFHHGVDNFLCKIKKSAIWKHRKLFTSLNPVNSPTTSLPVNHITGYASTNVTCVATSGSGRALHCIGLSAVFHCRIKSRTKTDGFRCVKISKSVNLNALDQCSALIGRRVEFHRAIGISGRFVRFVYSARSRKPAFSRFT